MTAQITIIKPAPQGILARPTDAPALGVLGGLFNPVTRAHIALGLAAWRDFSLNEVLFILPQVPPHKPLFGACLEDRLGMMRLALDTYDQFSIGLSREGLFLDICRGLRSVYPAATRIYFITGRDAAERILTWPYPDRAGALRDMFACFELMVADRGSAFVLPPDPLLSPYAGKIHRLALPAHFHEHSSTLARERRRQGLDIRELVPDAVCAFIQERGLYL